VVATTGSSSSKKKELDEVERTWSEKEGVEETVQVRHKEDSKGTFSFTKL